MAEPKKNGPPKEEWSAVGVVIKNCAVIRFRSGRWTETGPDARGCYTYESKETNSELSARAVGEQSFEGFRSTKKGSKVTVCGSILHIPDDGFEELKK